jgi:hypothetical protein
MKSTLNPAQIHNLELGLGCENCGCIVKRITKYGREYCGRKMCREALNYVDEAPHIPILTEQEIREIIRESL